MAIQQDMDFEAHEIERGFDFANLTFGAFLSAYLGIQLVQSVPTSEQMTKVVCLLAAIALVGHSFRGVALSLVRGIHTKKYLISSVFTLVSGAVAYTWITLALSYNTAVMGPLAIGWLATCLLVSIPMIARRWIKFYE